VNCINCAKPLVEGQNFCGSCGWLTPKPKEPSQSKVWFPKEDVDPASSMRKPRNPKTKKRLFLFLAAIGALVAVVTTVNLVSDAMARSEYAKYEHPDDGKPHDLLGHFDKAALKDALSDNCEFNSIFATESEISKLKKHTEILKNAYKNGGRAALKALKADWAFRVNANEYDLNINDKLLAPSSNSLIKLFKTNSKLAPEEAKQWLVYWGRDLAMMVAQKCHVPKDNSRWHTWANNFNASVSSALASANSIPWYPDGYTEWSGDSTLAWKWTSGSCELGDYCWHVQVITQLGCSSNLYAELNLIDGSDNIVGYTNDLTGSLQPNSRAILEFSSYQDGVSSGRLTELSCY
jgi:hypothetical protein